MVVLTLPQASRGFVAACVATQAVVLAVVARHDHRSILLCVVAFFIAGYVTDLISGFAHFGFDYIWPAEAPIMGPIAVEFRHHHDEPTLDPSALATNFTKGGYGALPFALITLIVTLTYTGSAASFLVAATLMATSIWMLGFHQIHAYAHMGSRLSPDDFNRAVAEISRLPRKRDQKREFARLFQDVGIPKWVRVMQRCRLFLRPEIHWQHHNTFETDFSSVNGWSDSLMNVFYRPVAQRKKAAGWARPGPARAQPFVR